MKKTARVVAMSRKPVRASAKGTGRRRSRKRQAEIGDESAQKHKAEHRPAAIDALDGEIASGIEPDLVGQREEMRGRRYQRQSGQHHGKKPDDRYSVSFGFSSSSGLEHK